MDNKSENKNNEENVLRGKVNCHTKDIISADYSHNLGLIATGSRNHRIRLWEYEKVKFEDELKGHTNEITLVKFIPPFPLLITCDNTGELMLWLTIPHDEGNKLLIKWRNMFTLQKMCPITSIDSCYDDKKKSLKIIVGDEMGYVRIQDASQLLTEIDIKPIDVTKNIKRNPWRIFKMDKKSKSKEFDVNDDSDDESAAHMEKEIEPALEEGIFKQISQWKAHKDSIKFIKYIDETDVSVIFTAGLDRMAKAWSTKGDLMGTLRQGIMRVPDKPWDFPLGDYENKTEDRNTSVEQMLEEVKKKRDLEMQSRKMFPARQDKKKTMTSRAMDKTAQPVIGSLGKTFHKELDYSNISSRYYGGDYGDSERDKVEDHSSKVKRLLETVKRMTEQTARANLGDDAVDEEEEKLNSRKIGPFQFDIDHDIDSEILKNEEVYKDLKELDEKFIKKEKTHSYLAAKSFGRKKKKNKY